LVDCWFAAAAGAAGAADCFWVLERDADGEGGKFVCITLSKATMGYESWPALLVADLPDTSITHRVSVSAYVPWGGGERGRGGEAPWDMKAGLHC
jgi:hypothetical protein